VLSITVKIGTEIVAFVIAITNAAGRAFDK